MSEVNKGQSSHLIISKAVQSIITDPRALVSVYVVLFYVILYAHFFFENMSMTHEELYRAVLV